MHACSRLLLSPRGGDCDGGDRHWDARELALPDLEAHCFNTIGYCARRGSGTSAASVIVEESLRIGLEHCPPFEVERMYRNAAVHLFSAGRLAKADARHRAALDIGASTGLPSGTGSSRSLSATPRGRWQEAWDRVAGSGPARTLGHSRLMTESPICSGGIRPGAIERVTRQAIDLARSSQRDLDVARTLMFFLGFRARIARAAGETRSSTSCSTSFSGSSSIPRQMYAGLLV